MEILVDANKHVISFLKLGRCKLDFKCVFFIQLLTRKSNTKLQHSLSLNPAFMSSQLFTILLSRQKMAEFKNGHNLETGQVLVLSIAI